MFFEKYPITKLFFNVKRKEKKKLLKSSLDCYSIYQMLPHCALLHHGMERTSSIMPI